jgi:hypothetical protein
VSDAVEYSSGTLEGRPHPPLRVHLTRLGANSLSEIGVSSLGAGGRPKAWPRSPLQGRCRCKNSRMPDITVATTVISTIGALAGALGGIALTGGLNTRQEERKVLRQRRDEHAAMQRQAYADLLGAAAEMRVHIETTCERYWKDMNARLTAIQDHAVQVGLQASRSALLSPQAVAEAALALGRVASTLSAWAVSNTVLGEYGGPDGQFIAGEMRSRPDLSEFDQRTEAFFRQAAEIMSQLA